MVFAIVLIKTFVLRGSTDFRTIKSEEELDNNNEDQGNTRILIEFGSRF